MKVLVTYDIDTTCASGKKRLVRIAAKCLDHGVRVQNSVYECELNAAQLRSLQSELEVLIDPSADRVLLYNLGNAWEGRCTCLGKGIDLRNDSFVI